jgi:hypothetical protein
MLPRALGRRDALRLHVGRPVPAGPGDPHPAPARHDVRRRAFVWPDLEPGPHRILEEVRPIDAPMGVRLTLAAPFDVIP